MFQRCSIRPSAVVLCLVLCPLSSVLLTGCKSSSKQSGASGDPLFGSPPVKQTGYTPPPSPDTRNNSVSSTMPAPSSTTSTAALAGGGHPSLDATHDLRIGSADTQPPRDAWRGQSSDTGIVVSAPQPTTAPEASVRNDARPPNGFTLTGGSSAVMSFDQAWAALRTRGMTWSCLESGDNPSDWRFACWIPNRQNPDIHRTYEAAGADPLMVLRAVLAKIDQDQ
jgi:hypothetical protein